MSTNSFNGTNVGGGTNNNTSEEKASTKLDQERSSDKSMSATIASSPTKASHDETQVPISTTSKNKNDDILCGDANGFSSHPFKKQKTGAIETSAGCTADPNAERRKEILAFYKDALVRREEACLELVKIENEADISNIPLFEDYAKDPVYLPTIGLSTKSSKGASISQDASSDKNATAIPLGLNMELRKVEQFFPPSNSSTPATASSVAQAVQQAAQAPSLVLQQMQMLQDQQLQQQYAAQSLAAHQQAAVHQLQQQQQQGYYQTASQSVYTAPLVTGSPGAASQTTDPSLLLLAAQYQQNANPSAVGAGAMYLPSAPSYAPIPAPSSGNALSLANAPPPGGPATAHSQLSDAINLAGRTSPPAATENESSRSSSEKPSVANV